MRSLALGPLCPIPTPWWKRYVYDVICIVKKDQVDILFNHINQMDAHIKFTMEPPDSEGGIPFLDMKCSINSDNTICTTVYRKPTHTDRYLDWNSNHLTSANRSVIQALTHRLLRRTNPALSHNIGKIYIPNILNQLLRTIYSPNAYISTNPNITQNPPIIPSIRSPEEIYLHN